MAHVPTINGVLEVGLYVDNVDRSVRFYQTLFGFDIIASDDRLCALGVCGKHVLLVCQRKASANLPKGAHDADGRQHMAFSIPADELQDWEARLGQQGVAIEDDRHWPRGGRSLYFRDPDGHLIELASPGVWSIY